MGRTDRVELTVEGRVLRTLRLKNGLSMRAAGEIMGYSDSLISQIENGREKPPKGERLAKFLKCYGDITEKYFKQLCKEFEEDETDEFVITELIKKLRPEQLKAVRVLCETLAAKKI